MKGYIKELKTQIHKSLPGVRIMPLSNENPKSGVDQEVLVIVEPNMTIPLHTHNVDADMFIVNGAGNVLSSDLTLNERSVALGAQVHFEARVAHGFRAGAKGLSFISRNGGIVDSSEEKWDIKFS